MSGNLRDFEFTDLYFSESGDAFVRGAESEHPIDYVPDEFSIDLADLHRRVVERGAREPEFFVDMDGVRYRVAKIDSVDGVWYALRRSKFPIPRLGEIGINPRIIQYLGQIGRRHGLILFAGATGNGKTTTACSLLQEYLLSYGDVAITIEDPPELPLNGTHGDFGRCFQIKVENGDFGRAMTKTMRYNPRYILLGEIRAPYEASQALRAAINGHLVISTIHADNCIGALNSLLKLVSGQENLDLARGVLADGIAGVIHQKLLKTKTGRKPKIEFLFAGYQGSESAGIRTKIRQGKLEQLSTEIEIQANRIMQGKFPVGD